MNIISRVKAPTPLFFKKLRNVSLILAGLGGALLSTPVAVPALIAKFAGYLAVAGSVGAAVSQSVTTGDEQQQEADKDGQ
jgi:hypothetical protein